MLRKKKKKKKKKTNKTTIPNDNTAHTIQCLLWNLDFINKDENA
jgi:hypothetical protein